MISASEAKQQTEKIILKTLKQNINMELQLIEQKIQKAISKGEFYIICDDIISHNETKKALKKLDYKVKQKC